MITRQNAESLFGEIDCEASNSGHNTSSELEIFTDSKREASRSLMKRRVRVECEWSDGESNPDLLNAIQPSSR